MQAHFWLPYPEGEIYVSILDYVKVEQNGNIMDGDRILARPVNNLRAVYKHEATGIEFREWSVTQ